MQRLTRRQALTMAAATASALVAGRSVASAQSNSADAVISNFTGGRPIKKDKVKLILPETVDHGGTVALSVSVESPMTASDYVSRVLVVAPGNPRPQLAIFHFSPLSGVADASTRVRLAKTQDVIGIAELSDGSFYSAAQRIEVAVSGCDA